MGVLPDRSKSIVPTVYHPLMTESSSPIIDFYPRDFELDMNGKKMEWEAVVKIPFIDEKRLLSAMGPKNELLSDDEKSRNSFGVSLKFTYDRTLDYTYPSSLTGEFPDIQHCKVVENIYDLPVAEGLELYRGLMRGAKLNAAALAGFPSLATLAYNGQLGFHGVKVFQQESRNESMVITLSDVDERSRVGAAKAKLGKKCFVGYPFLQEAKIVRVSDELFEYSLAEDGSGEVVTRDHNGREINDWSAKADRTESFYSARLGIIIGNVESMVHVEMLKGLNKTDEGALVKEYGFIPGAETDHPAQVVVDEVISEDQRFIEKAALPIEEEFPVKSRVFYLGDNLRDLEYEAWLKTKQPSDTPREVKRPAYGRPVEIIGHRGNRANIVTSLFMMKPKSTDPQEAEGFARKLDNFVKTEPNFAKLVIKDAERQNPYFPSYTVAQQLDMKPLVLSKITASFFVQTVGGMRVNLGLNLKFEARKLKVLGYSRKTNAGWEFSPAAFQLIIEYMTTFPDFFAALKNLPQGNELSETDIFRDPTYASQRVKEIGAWIKTKGRGDFEKVPLEAEQLDSVVVQKIEQAIDNLLADAPQPVIRNMNDVPRSALIRPQDVEQRLGSQQFTLGDRVTYVQDSGKVPIGLKGTVVGISNIGSTPMLDVIFDQTFMGGSSLSERCSPFRGGVVPANSVLNTSYPQLMISSKGRRIQSTPIAQSLAGAGSGARGNGRYVGTNGHAYREASAPAPLQGSYRGAVNGGSPSYRGRGRGGYPQPHANGAPQHANLAYRPAPSARGGRGGGALFNTQVQPAAGAQQSAGYNAVPPPANLNERGRGRGRGRGQRGGRGGPNRGRGGAAQPQIA